MTYYHLLNNKQFAEALKYAEREIYFQSLRYHKYNQSAAARSLDVSRGTLRSKLKNWGYI